MTFLFSPARATTAIFWLALASGAAGPLALLSGRIVAETGCLLPEAQSR